MAAREAKDQRRQRQEGAQKRKKQAQAQARQSLEGAEVKRTRPAFERGQTREKLDRAQAAKGPWLGEAQETPKEKRLEVAQTMMLELAQVRMTRPLLEVGRTRKKLEQAKEP